MWFQAARTLASTATPFAGRGLRHAFGTASFIALIENVDDISQYDISILLTGDEEVGGLNGTKAVLDTAGYACDVCILPDAGDALGTMSVAAKGIYQLQLRANGRLHHGSRPWEGDGAANKLLAFLTGLSTAFDPSSRDNSTFVVSQLQAGNTALNQARPRGLRVSISVTKMPTISPEFAKL